MTNFGTSPNRKIMKLGQQVLEALRIQLNYIRQVLDLLIFYKINEVFNKTHFPKCYKHEIQTVGTRDGSNSNK